MSKEIIYKQDAINALDRRFVEYETYGPEDDNTRRVCDGIADAMEVINNLPSAQPEYEELTQAEVVSEIARGSVMSTWYWFDVMIQLKQMGYAICRKK